MKSVANKVAVVTGAASGIGRALAQQLSQEGAHLALTDINMDGLEETKSQLSGNTKVTLHKVDAASREQVETLVKDVVKEHGHVDIVINNAGVALSESVANATYENMQWLMDINFWGVVYGTKAFLPELMKRPQAAIINISSIFGIIALPTQSTYNAAKFAVRGFTESLRQELKDSNVFVACVHPGGIDTGIVKNGRMLESMDGKEKTHEQQMKEFKQVAKTTPAKAADVILSGMKKGKRRILIGADAKAMDRIQRWFPEKYTDIFGRLLQLKK